MTKNLLYVLISLLLGASAAVAAPPFSGPEDVAFAKKLWKALEINRLVGADRFQSMPYKTPPPHGHFVESLAHGPPLRCIRDRF